MPGVRHSGHMKVAAIVALSLVLLGPLVLTAQMRRRSAVGRSDIAPTGLNGVTIEVQGVLKGLSKKELLVETPEGQTMSLRRTSKTKFLRAGKPVKADDVAVDEQVHVEVAEDTDAKLMAVVVKLEAAEKPRTLKQR